MICIKRFISVLILVLLTFSFASCGGMTVSTEKYDEISSCVLENIDALSPEKELEFFDYETAGVSIGGVYYGYYYTANNDIEVPDFYSGGNLGERYEADGGTYFGKPNNGTDWCFIKKITDKWYYYELHWA